MRFVLLLLIAYFQVQASLSDNINGLYEDTEQKLLNFSKEIDEKFSNARLAIKVANYSIIDQEFVKLENSKTQIQETAYKYISKYEEWIQKAKKLNVNPENCTKDLEEIEILLPRDTYANITNNFKSESDDLNHKSIGMYQNLTHIPEIVEELKKDFYNCSKTDNKCIENISKALDENKGLFNQIQEITVTIINIFREILQVLDTCIERNIHHLDEKEKELTDKGIECIKELLK